jgi:hypothetical protein
MCCAARLFCAPPYPLYIAHTPHGNNSDLQPACPHIHDCPTAVGTIWPLWLGQCVYAVCHCQLTVAVDGHNAIMHAIYYMWGVCVRTGREHSDPRLHSTAHG